jgi:hypothetical protein
MGALFLCTWMYGMSTEQERESTIGPTWWSYAK